MFPFEMSVSSRLPSNAESYSKEKKFLEWGPFEPFKPYYYYLYNSHVCVCVCVRALYRDAQIKIN
jgi:hypothetical protein